MNYRSLLMSQQVLQLRDAVRRVVRLNSCARRENGARRTQAAYECARALEDRHCFLVCMAQRAKRSEHARRNLNRDARRRSHFDGAEEAAHQNERADANLLRARERTAARVIFNLDFLLDEECNMNAAKGEVAEQQRRGGDQTIARMERTLETATRSTEERGKQLAEQDFVVQPDRTAPILGERKRSEQR